MRSSVIALLLLGSFGCGTYVSSTPINGAGSRPPRGARSVAIYSSGPPDRPYRELAVMQVEQDRGLNERGMNVMLDRLRDRAGQMGCDGVVLGGISERDGAAWHTLWPLDTGSTTLTATCIVFRDQRRPSHVAATTRPELSPPASGQRWDGEEPR